MAPHQSSNELLINGQTIVLPFVLTVPQEVGVQLVLAHCHILRTAVITFAALLWWVGWRVGLLVCWRVGCVVGWLVGWLAGCLCLVVLGFVVWLASSLACFHLIPNAVLPRSQWWKGCMAFF